MTRSLLGLSLRSFALLAFAALVAAGCSSGAPSDPSTESCVSGSTVTCTCENGQKGSQLCGSPTCTCAAADAGAVDDDAGRAATVADAGGEGAADTGSHAGSGGGGGDGPAPSALYGACASKGSFGWPCSVDNGPDPTDCTDPRFPYCFAGGQGSWCTVECGDAGFAVSCAAETTGCAPTACNAKGYCK